MNSAVTPPVKTNTDVRPADRLGFTVFVAVTLHIAIILGVGFALEPPAELSKTLEVTLSTFKSDEKPKQADFIAQDNQQGSGTLEHKAAPKTTEQAIFQTQEARKVTPPKAASSQTPSPQTPKATLTTQSAQLQKSPPPRQQPTPAPNPNPAPVFDSSMLSSEIASLEAELAREVQAYAKRPRIHRLNAASTQREKGAWYKDEWRKKVERIGNLNYPDDARRQRIYGSLRLLVSINRDGSLYEVQLLESSGEAVLDQAAMRIVRLAAPYAPFTGDLADIDRLEIIRTWRFERGDRLSSN